MSSDPAATFDKISASPNDVSESAAEATKFRGSETTAVSQGSQIGRRLGNFIIECELGSGGMGTVYRAQQVHPVRRTVALKVIRPEAIGPGIVERFLAERQTLARMDHPDIATILDAGSDEGQPYFAMEFADGQPLDAYCDSHRLGISQRVRLMIRVIRAIEHAHQRGVLHRDVKPDNVLVSGTPDRAVVKVIDFGIAKDAEATDNAQTKNGEVLGTPYFMSPEQVSGSVDNRSDVYSLGATLFRILTGRYCIAFPANAGVAEIMQRVVQHEPIGLQRLYARMSPEQKAKQAAVLGTQPRAVLQFFRGDLDTIVLQTLANDRLRRYANAGDFADDLERFLSNRPVLAAKPTWSYRAGKFVKRHRSIVTAGFVAAIVALGSASVVGVREYQSQRAAEIEANRLESEVALLLDSAEHELAGEFAMRMIWEDSLQRAEATLARGVDLLGGAAPSDPRFELLTQRATNIRAQLDEHREAGELVDAMTAGRDWGTGSEAYGQSMGDRANADSLSLMETELAKAGLIIPSPANSGTPVSEVIARFQSVPAPLHDDLIDSLEFMIANGPVGVGMEVSCENLLTGEKDAAPEKLPDRRGTPWVSQTYYGRPATLNEQIEHGHYLLGIASPAESQFVSTQDWDERQVARALIGRPGTSVRLQLESPFGEQYEATLLRDGHTAFWAVDVLAGFDPDTNRTAQRRAILTRDYDRLIELATREGVENERPFTLIQLADALPESEFDVKHDLLRKARSKNPGNFWTNMALASLLSSGHPNANASDGLRFLTAAAAIRPKNTSTNTRLAMTLMMTPLQRSAREQLEYAVEIEPGNTQTRYMLAQYLRYTGDYQASIVHYEKLVELEGPQSGTLCELAHAYGRVGAIEQQIETLTQAVELADGEPTARYRLIGVLRNAGRDSEAEKHVLATEFDDAPDYRSLAMMATFGLGEGEEAKVELDPRYMRERIEAGLTPFERHKFHGFVFANTGQMWAAIAAFDEALRIEPADEQSLRWKAENESLAAVRGG